MTYNSIISPDGETNGILFEQTGLAASNSAYNYGLTTNDGTYSYSLFIKAKDSTKSRFYSSNGASTLIQDFNPLEMTEGILSGDLSLKFEDYGNGWFRVSFTRTLSSAASHKLAIYPDRNNTQKSVYIFGLQVEALSYPTSYIPTNGLQVTRDAETCTGAGEAIDFNSEEGVLYAEIAALADGGDTRAITIYSAANNRITLSLHSTTNRVQFYIAMNGYVNTVDLDATDISQTNMNKIACKFKANDYALWINGVEKDTNTTQSNTVQSGTLNSLNFDINGSNNFYGKVKAIRVYKEALSDTDLQNLTS